MTDSMTDSEIDSAVSSGSILIGSPLSFKLMSWAHAYAKLWIIGNFTRVARRLIYALLPDEIIVETRCPHHFLHFQLY